MLTWGFAKAARTYVQSGKRVVVDVDLAKFFDRVNHDILMGRLRKRIGDAAVLALIRAYLDAGIMNDGVVLERYQGTPQGGPLSPLLAPPYFDAETGQIDVAKYEADTYVVEIAALTVAQELRTKPWFSFRR